MSVTELLKIVSEFGGDLALVYLKQLDEYVIRSRDHNVFPESEISNILFEDNPLGFHFVHGSFDVVGLDSKMMYARTPRILGRLIIEVEPAGSDSHEHVSGAGHIHVQDHFTPEEMFVEFDTALNVRGEYMNVMQVIGQVLLLKRIHLYVMMTDPG